jgi:hypothetical protein
VRKLITDIKLTGRTIVDMTAGADFSMLLGRDAQIMTACRRSPKRHVAFGFQKGSLPDISRNEFPCGRLIKQDRRPPLTNGACRG